MTMQQDTTQEETDTLVRHFIPLHVKDCVSCGHLVSHVRQFKDNCHWSNGNDHCPAKSIKLGVGVNYDLASDKIAEAFLTDDILALKRRVDKLAGLDEEVGTRVLQLVREKVFTGMVAQGYELAPESEADEGEDEEMDSTELRRLPSDLDDDSPETASDLATDAELAESEEGDSEEASETDQTQQAAQEEDSDDEWNEA